MEKNSKCEKDGIKLYRIREGLQPLNDSSIDFIARKDQKDLDSVIDAILEEIIGISFNVDADSYDDKRLLRDVMAKDIDTIAKLASPTIPPWSWAPHTPTVHCTPTKSEHLGSLGYFLQSRISGSQGSQKRLS